MNRFFKAVFCAVMLASLVGCGGDDGDAQERDIDPPVEPPVVTATKYVFEGLGSNSAIENFAVGSPNSTLQLSTSLFYLEALLPDKWNLDKYVKLLGTGSYGAKYVIKKDFSEDEAAEFLKALVLEKKFNKTYLSQFLDLTIVGAKLNDLLNALGYNDELRRFGVGFDLGDISGLFLNTDLYIDRGSVKIDQVVDNLGNTRNIVTLTTYITGTLDDLDDEALVKIYGEKVAYGKVVSTKTEKIYSPHVLSNDYILVKYVQSLAEKDNFLPLGKREAVKEDNFISYSLAFDHGADLVTWSAEKDINVFRVYVDHRNGTIEDQGEQLF